MILRLLLLAAALLGAAFPRTLVIAHRGEHLRNPENTLPAFREAIRLGADYVEADVRTTADGVLVLSHDARAIATTPFAQLQLTRFDELLDLARGKIGVYVDAKAVSAADLVSHLARHGMEQQAVIYCGERLAQQLRALNPRLAIMPEALNPDHVRALASTLKPTVFAFDDRDFNPATVAAAKQFGARVFVDRLGAADTPAAWQSAIDAGADAIQTDHPGELAEFLALDWFAILPIRPVTRFENALTGGSIPGGVMGTGNPRRVRPPVEAPPASRASLIIEDIAVLVCFPLSRLRCKGVIASCFTNDSLQFSHCFVAA